MDEGGPSAPSVSLGRSKGPKMRGQSVWPRPLVMGMEPRRRGRGTSEHLGNGWAQSCPDQRARPWRTPGFGSVSTGGGTTELRT